jgi:tRNA threonylcarbamoyladenosine biosynthesis protein TsaE
MRSPRIVTHETRSAQETERLGAELATHLRAGDLVLLEGELGTGKTTLVRGACSALGVASTVTSPTFTIGQRYPAPVPVSHVDLFRVASIEDEDPDLLADYVRNDAIAFVEWPGAAETNLQQIGRVAYRLRLSHAGGDRRIIEVEQA